MERAAARAHMARAVEVMRLSVHENRSDGKVPPKVGVVLVSSDGRTVEGARGELRSGDHAEFTVLERKCRDRPLDGAVLFTTLEPCAPGARQHPKLPCAERLVLARIAEVWVGIEDPDPTVDREGIRYLQANGIAVEMFDRDLQETIRVENRTFLEQALERAGEVLEVELPRPAQSPFDEPVAGAGLGDLSDAAVRDYGDRLARHRGA